jgi:hypothetical protein
MLAGQRKWRRRNPLWGAPRIHGELFMLGFEVAQSRGAKFMVRCGQMLLVALQCSNLFAGGPFAG